MAGMPTIGKSRSAVAGVLLIVLGAWGGLAHFVGPYFHYAYTSDMVWHVSMARLWLEIVPAAAAMAGGVLVVVSTGRLPAAGGAVLAMLAGGWFVAGSAVNQIWPHLGTLGVPAGTSAARMAAEELGMFTGPGVLIVLCAALVLGCASATLTQTATGPDAGEQDEEEPEEAGEEETGTLAGSVLAEDFRPAAGQPAQP